jgi:hypothetical protein
MTPDHITPEHRLRACGLSAGASRNCCPNKYTAQTSAEREMNAQDTQDDDVIIVDEDLIVCNRKRSKASPTCLNYLGQEQWENDGTSCLNIILSVFLFAHYVRRRTKQQVILKIR